MKKYSNELVVGLDVSDKKSEVCMMQKADGEISKRESIKTERETFLKYFSSLEKSLIILEVGTHSPWMSRLIKSLGHEVIVANARKISLIYGSKRKNDQIDAEKLARLARVDRTLLHPVEHRDEQKQADLNVIRSRKVLLKTRQQLINSVRARLKSFGIKPPQVYPAGFHKKAIAYIPETLKLALMPIIEILKGIHNQIKGLDKEIAELAEQRYPETALLTQVAGVGQLIALTYVLTLADPKKFKKSRSVGAYLGLAPGQDQSGSHDPKQSITKEGDPYLRSLLVQSANYILGHFGPDCDLRRFAYDRLEHQKEALKKKGKDPNKVKVSKQLKIAVARKLAVLLHHLWVSAEVYDPFFSSSQRISQDNAMISEHQDSLTSLVA